MIHSFSILPQHERRLPTSAAGEGRARASLSFSRMLAMIAGHSSPFRRPSLAALRLSFSLFLRTQRKHRPAGSLCLAHIGPLALLYFFPRARNPLRGKPAGFLGEDRLTDRVRSRSYLWQAVEMPFFALFV